MDAWKSCVLCSWELDWFRGTVPSWLCYCQHVAWESPELHWEMKFRRTWIALLLWTLNTLQLLLCWGVLRVDIAQVTVHERNTQISWKTVYVLWKGVFSGRARVKGWVLKSCSILWRHHVSGWNGLSTFGTQLWRSFGRWWRVTSSGLGAVSFVNRLVLLVCTSVVFVQGKIPSFQFCCPLTWSRLGVMWRLRVCVCLWILVEIVFAHRYWNCRVIGPSESSWNVSGGDFLCQKSNQQAWQHQRKLLFLPTNHCILLSSADWFSWNLCAIFSEALLFGRAAVSGESCLCHDFHCRCCALTPGAPPAKYRASLSLDAPMHTPLHSWQGLLPPPLQSVYCTVKWHEVITWRWSEHGPDTA